MAAPALNTRSNWRLRQFAAVGLAGVAGAALVFGLAARAPSDDPAVTASWEQGVFVVERDGLRYAYHAVSGSESLHDLAADPECRANLAAARPEDVARLRAHLERTVGKTIRELREPHAPTIRRLEALGYL